VYFVHRDREVVSVFVLRFRAPLRMYHGEILNPWIMRTLKPAFAGGIDTVGGVILENIIKSTNQWGDNLLR
jgi:hypothetical protein